MLGKYLKIIQYLDLYLSFLDFEPWVFFILNFPLLFFSKTYCILLEQKFFFFVRFVVYSLMQIDLIYELYIER